MPVFKILAMGSGQGSTIEFFLKQTALRQNPAFKIVALVTENPNSQIPTIAKTYHLPCHIVKYKDKDFKVWDKELCKTLLSYKPELIVLAGFLKKIGPKVLNQFKNKIINSHPSLLPKFAGPGMFGLKVHQAVIKAQQTQTGVSIHVVSPNYDEGPILAQKKIPVKKTDSPLELEHRVKKIEKQFYYQTILKIINKPS